MHGGGSLRAIPETLSPATAAATGRGRRLVVAWTGLDPGTLRALGAQLEGVELRPAGAGGSSPATEGEVDLFHLGHADLARLGELRQAQPGAAVVLDLRSRAGRLGWRDVRRARAADAVLVATRWQAEALGHERPSLAGRAAVAPLPVDLDEFAPRDLLARARDAELKRFRRLHRLADPVILYVGPYTAEGGLDVLLDAAERLGRRGHEVRLAAVPAGRVDQRYLDRCEERALALGHRCIIEWHCPLQDLPLWCALATIVCLPYRKALDPTPVQLASAAARPVVASSIESLREMVADGETGVLVPPEDPEAVAAALETLLGDPGRAGYLGDQGRARAEATWSFVAVARRLLSVWLEQAARRGAG